MSDFFDSFVSTSTSIISAVGDSITIVKDASYEELNAAQRVFGTAGEQGFTSYNLPKQRNCFVVEFVISEFAKNFIATQLPDTHTNFSSYNVSCMVKDTAIPSFSFDVEKVNQYNKTRIIAGNVNYKPVTMTFYDTVDSAAFLLMDAYRKYYYGDFFAKTQSSYTNDVLSSPSQFDVMGINWGRSVMNVGNYDAQYFFQQINIYEVDNSKYTIHNMFNVYIEDVSFENKSMESTGDPSLITLSLRYEAASNLNNSGYQSIGASSSEIATVLTNTDGLGKSGFFKYFGELDDKSVGLTTIGKIIRAGAAGSDIITSISDIASGNYNADTIRNIGNAIVTGASAIGLGSIVSSANESFGLGNLLGDF